MRRLATLVGLSVLLVGCAGLDDFDDRTPVSRAIAARIGTDLGPARPPGETAVPSAVQLEDGIDEEEAVALALWNNAAFNEALEQLGFARADLIQAGLLQNPILSVLFPIGPKQLELTLRFPLEALWLRPTREKIATIELDRVSAALVQSGLDLMRDTRVSHAELVQREAEERLAARSAEVFDAIARLIDKRLAAGDVSVLEARLARVDALEARRESQRLREEVAVSRERFRQLVGLTDHPTELTVVPSAPRTRLTGDREALLEQAWASRPDLRAAELALESALERVGLEKWQAYHFSGVIDANGPNGEAFELGPGAQASLPIFNANDGNLALADAGVRRAARATVTLRHAIRREVGESWARVKQTIEALEAFDSGILPELEAALQQAETLFTLGETSEQPVLETRARLWSTRRARAGAEARLLAAWAELERSLGSRIEEEER